MEIKRNFFSLKKVQKVLEKRRNSCFKQNFALIYVFVREVKCQSNASKEISLSKMLHVRYAI